MTRYQASALLTFTFNKVAIRRLVTRTGGGGERRAA